MFIADLPLYKKLTKKRSLKFAEYLAKLVPENTSVLDFGCGNMFTAMELTRLVKGIHVTGLDVVRDQNLNDETLAQKNLSFTLLTTKELPFADEHFDIVIALASMHHTEDPEYYLSELKRVTKKDGAVILVEEMYINLFDKIYISAQDWVLNKMKAGVPVPLNFRSYKHYTNEFKRQKLNVAFEGGIRAFLTGMHAYVFKLTKA